MADLNQPKTQTAPLSAEPPLESIGESMTPESSTIPASKFIALKEHDALHVVGVVGFSGQWSEEKIAADPVIKSHVRHARHLLEETLKELSEKHGDKLVVSSGATMEGVPKLVYEVCEELGIKAMGVACQKAFNYPLGKMDYFIVEGSNWGDESPTFLETADEFLMLGGGGQAKRQMIAASQDRKKVTVFKGLGGTADELTGFDIRGATFVIC